MKKYKYKPTATSLKIYQTQQKIFKVDNKSLVTIINKGK